MPEAISKRFLRVPVVAERTGLSERLILRRIRAGEVEAFWDPRDRRFRVVAEEDLAQLTSVRRFGEGRRTSAAERMAS
jgi:hypothetical protein